MLRDLQLVAPELILCFGALGLLMVAAFVGDRSLRLVNWLSVALLGAAGLVLLGPAGNGGDAYLGLYRADLFASFAKVLIFGASAVAILAANDWFTRDGTHRPEYPILVLLAAAGSGIMVSASDLLTLYVGVELQSLAAYVLASFQRRDDRSVEAGLKYFVLGALASGILLYGISLLYGFTGTTLFDGISRALAGPEGISTGELFGLVFVFAGLAFKIAAVPFHMWTPDVYEGAPTPVTTLFATAQKVSAMALLVRVAIEAMGPAADGWRQIVIFSALASTILGGVAGVGQANIKRLLAYSSINNVGFALIGLVPGTREGVSSVLFYLAVYVAMTLGAFLCVMRMRDLDGRPVETIGSLSGLSRTQPGLALALLFFMLSLAGFPPFLGLWPKLLVFQAAVNEGYVALAAVGIVTSVIAAYYYLKIVKTMYFDEPAGAYEPGRRTATGVVIVAAALFVSPLGYLLIGPLQQASLNAASSLL